MTDQILVTRLLLALIVVVYGLLAMLRGRDTGFVPPRARHWIALVGLVPFVAWVVAPGALKGGEVEVALEVRRLALVVGAAGIGLRYAAVRNTDRSERACRRLATIASVAVLAAIALGSANWLVTAAAAVSIAALCGLNSSEASARGDQQPPRDQPER